MNGEKVDKDYILEKSDILTHYNHCHEPPVCHNAYKNGKPNNTIKVLGYSPITQLLALYKPSSIPVLPMGRYRFNTLREIFKYEINTSDKYQELKQIELNNCFRLDKTVSGVVVFGTNMEGVKRYQEFNNNGSIIKEYLAKVNGQFPKKVLCDAPVSRLDPPVAYETQTNARIKNVDEYKQMKFGVDQINGKESATEFELIHYNAEENTSFILCKPITGRTHQIRVHLEYLGFPICNDELYGGKTSSKHQLKFWNDNNNNRLKSMITFHRDNDCRECYGILNEIDGKWRTPFDTTNEIYLHCYKNECIKSGYEWIFKAKPPSWFTIKL